MKPASEPTSLDRRRERSGALHRNSQDLIGGLILLLFAGLVLWATRDLPGQQGFTFGPGTAPRLFAILLAGNAALVMVSALFSDGPNVRYSLTASLAIGALGAIWFGVYQLTGGTLEATAALTIASLAGITILDRVEVRGPTLITVSILGFAAFIQPLGLIVSTFLLVFVSAAANREFRLLETIIWGAIISVFCALLFPYVLNLSMPLMPRGWPDWLSL